MSEHTFSETLREQILERLTVFPVERDPRSDLRKAAVVVAIAPLEDQASVLVTLRPQKLNRHGGQYALPGGRLDPGETDEQAALRELDEELGLHLPTDAILGRLDDFPTRSGFRIAPLVVWAEDLRRPGVRCESPTPGRLGRGSERNDP